MNSKSVRGEKGMDYHRVGLISVILALGFVACGHAASEFTYGPFRELHTDQGPISFGLIVSAEVVSWSAPTAKDLFIARCWSGVYLYPSKDLRNFGPPIQLCDGLGLHVLMTRAADWNGDGRQEVIGTDRNGTMLLLRPVGEYPNLRLEVAQNPLTAPDGVPYNIPFDNPHHRLSRQGEYIQPEYFNYTYPTVDPAGQGIANLIVGDWAGALWYMPFGGTKEGLPLYQGVRYAKRDGKEFARPKFRLADERGQPFLLGPATEAGVRYRGGASRPAAYHNARTGSDDLLVLCGNAGNELRYLQRIRTGSAGEPIFRDLGLVSLRGGPDDVFDPFSYHAVATIVGPDPWPDLLISRGCDLALYRNQRKAGPKPAFVFSRWLSGRDVPTRGYNYTEILKDTKGRRYLLENDNQWCFRELLKVKRGVQLSSQRHDLRDQNGVFRVEGGTDHVAAEKWGFHRAALWDYDGSGRQHLIVGTDKGLLYLLCEKRPLGTGGRFEFRSYGPLRDTAGNVIRVHNRVAAAPIDVDRDGSMDLILAGASYQMGIERDPNPGGGIYYALNRGFQPDGTPLLDPARPLETIGHAHQFSLNTHAQLQSLDLLGNGECLLVIATQDDGFRGYVYRPAQGRLAVEFTGMTLPGLSIEERLLDLDGDGDWEFVRSGGETLITTYAPVIPPGEQR